MKAKALFYGSFMVAVVASSPVAFGNNNLFLPGDAFFPTVLTKYDIDTLQATKTGERTFEYSSLGGYEAAFCGYAGYLNANIPAVDDAFAKNLATVYARIREYANRQLLEWTRNGKTELIETNGIRVLFYPADFQFPRYHLGLRYNENWVAEAVKFGHKKEHLRLCGLISDPDAIERDWRDADAVPPLKVKLPDVELKPGPETETPVVVQGPIKAMVIGSLSLNELFRVGDDEYLTLTIYIVDSQGISELVHQDGKWRTETSK